MNSPASSLRLQGHVFAVRALILAGATLLVVQPLLLLWAEQWLWLFGMAHLLGLPGVPADEAARWRMAGVSLLTVGGGLYALRQLWQLFGEYGAGRVFGVRAQAAWNRFAWAVLLLALLQPLSRALMTVAFSLSSPPGQRVASIGLTWHDCLHILFGFVLVAMARVMTEARRLADDNAGFV